MNPILQKVNQDGTAILQTSEVISQEEVASRIDSLNEQIINVRREVDSFQSKLSELQSDLSFYQNIQAQQQVAVAADPIQVEPVQAEPAQSEEIKL